jgi:hypothetical protein
MFLFIPSSKATSGACSYHDGVDCSAGADWDGSVICNDGWRDSSVQYSNMTSCETSKLIPDPYTLALQYCRDILGLSYHEFLNFDYEGRKTAITSECQHEICLDKEIESSAELERNINDCIAICYPRGKENAANEMERYCDLIAQNKIKQQNTTITKIKIFSSDTNELIIDFDREKSLATRPINEGSFTIDWSSNKLTYYKGFYVYFGQAQTMSDDLSNFTFTSNPKITVTNI